MPVPPHLQPALPDVRVRPGTAPPPRRLRELAWAVARRRYRVRPELVAEAILTRNGLDPRARPD